MLRLTASDLHRDFSSVFGAPLFCCLALLVGSSTSRAEFPGWQGLRVIEQKGRPYLLRAADFNGDGREELVVVNSRLSRLDLYGCRQRLATEQPGEQHPNELTLAPDMLHQELQLEQVPRDVLAHDLDKDGRPELIVLASSPNQVSVYRWQGPEIGDWSKLYQLDLLAGEMPARRKTLLIRPVRDNQFQLLVSMDSGIQQVLLRPGGRAEWLTPREQRGRIDWWLADLDGDGQSDLIEQTRESRETVRWYRGSASGTLTPAAVLRDRAAQDVEVMRTSLAAQLVVLDEASRGVLRRYELAAGGMSPFGRQLPIALQASSKAVWCGLQQGDQRALIVADRSSPRLLSYVLGDTGWQRQQAYPAVADIRGLARLSSEPGKLLVWTKDASDLQTSRWEKGRMTYPKPWSQTAEQEDRQILALDTVGPLTWWVQKVGKHLDLYLASLAKSEPAKVRFADVGTKADQVLWIGGERLLVKEKNSRALKLVALEGEKAKMSSPAHLKKATLAEFKLFSVGTEVQLGRLTDGVLQWLGDDLRSREQVMLPQGQTLADYVAEDAAAGWALQHDSPFVHRIEIDAARLSKSVQREKVAPGKQLLQDRVLGMLLVGQDRITQLSAGRGQELKLVEVIDERIGRAGGVRKTRFHRLSTTDVDHDGYDDLVLYDELEHRLTVLGASVAGDGRSGLQPIIAWPVFDDKKYPYSDDTEDHVKEPRSVLAADFDGDGLPDLALLCQDRLLVYLAREGF